MWGTELLCTGTREGIYAHTKKRDHVQIWQQRERNPQQQQQQQQQKKVIERSGRPIPFSFFHRGIKQVKYTCKPRLILLSLSLDRLLAVLITCLPKSPPPLSIPLHPKEKQKKNTTVHPCNSFSASYLVYPISPPHLTFHQLCCCYSY